MSEKQEKVSAPGTGAAYAFSWPVFVLSFGWMLYAIFGVNNLVLSAIFAFLKDSSGFLTFLCFVVIAAALLRRQKQYCLAVLNAVNIVLLNQLYLNSRWQALYETVRKFFAELNWPKVFFFGAMLAVAAYCAYAGLKQRRKNRSQEVAEPQQASDANKTRPRRLQTAAEKILTPWQGKPLCLIPRQRKLPARKAPRPAALPIQSPPAKAMAGKQLRPVRFS